MVNLHSSACQRQSLLCSCKCISSLYLQLENGKVIPLCECLCRVTWVFSYSVSVFQFMSDKPAYKSGTPAGNCIAWNMAYSRTDRCHRTRPLVEEMTPSTRSLTRLEPGNTFPGQYLLTWNPLSLVRCWSVKSAIFYHLACGSINRRGENWHLSATVSPWTTDHW